MELRLHSRVGVHVRCVGSALGLGGHVVIGVVLGVTTQDAIPSVEFFPLVVRLYSMIVNSYL